jgi:hypothetical protein
VILKKSKVAIVKGPVKPGAAEIAAAVRQAVGLVGGLDDRLIIPVDISLTCY